MNLFSYRFLIVSLLLSAMGVAVAGKNRKPNKPNKPNLIQVAPGKATFANQANRQAAPQSQEDQDLERAIAQSLKDLVAQDLPTEDFPEMSEEEVLQQALLFSQYEAEQKAQYDAAEKNDAANIAIATSILEDAFRVQADNAQDDQPEDVDLDQPQNLMDLPIDPAANEPALAPQQDDAAQAPAKPNFAAAREARLRRFANQ